MNAGDEQGLAEPTDSEAALTVQTGQRPSHPDRPSEDRIFTTPNAVIVLDGASQSIPLEHSGAWMAEELGQRLTALLLDQPQRPLEDALDEAVNDLITTNDLQPGTAPSTTVSIIRYNSRQLDVLVLCDSPVIVCDTAGTTYEIRDDRLADAGRRLAKSLGPDSTREQFAEQFETLRNSPDGFWCVSAHPDVAQHALSWSLPTDELAWALAMSDGVSIGVDYYREPATWGDAFALADADPTGLIDHVHNQERDDADCDRWPRGKVHDDKALAVVKPAANPLDSVAQRRQTKNLATELSREAFLALVDHTLLKPEATQPAIEALCSEALSIKPAAVCVNAYWASTVAGLLAGSGIDTCAVVGFPLGATNHAGLQAETAAAVAAGANEIDMVLPVGLFRTDQAQAAAYLAACRAAAGDDTVLKVILETALLETDEIVDACKIAVDTGANFVKTSTGFNPAGGATTGAVSTMRGAVGPAIGVKASGGIRTLADVEAMIAAGASRLGLSATLTIAEELVAF